MAPRLLDNKCGVAVIVFQQAGIDNSDGYRTVSELEEAAQEVGQLRDRIRLVIISAQSHEDDMQDISQATYVRNLAILLQILRGLPQFILGLADGPMCSMATAVFSTCDAVIATRRTIFQHYKGNRVVSLASAQRSQLVWRVVSNLQELRGCGEEFCMEIITQSPSQIAEVKNIIKFGRKASRQAAKERRKEQRQKAKETGDDEGDGKDEISDSEYVNTGGAASSAGSRTGPATSASSPSERTTLLISNLPSNITQQQLCEKLDELGFARKYDLIYMPLESTNQQAGQSAYGFVHFKDVEDAQVFKETYHNYRFNTGDGIETCTVTFAEARLKMIPDLCTMLL